MARKKITLAFIKNKTNRNASFRKRRKGLIKKVEEISTLCDVEACAIIFSPYDEKTEIWPSPEGALDVLIRYGAVSGIHHRPPKEMDQVSFTLHRLKKNHVKLDRLLMENKRNDLDCFMYRCMAGTNSLHDLDERERAEMCRLINQRIRDVYSKIENLMMAGVGGVAAVAPPPPVALHPTPPPVALLPPPPAVEEGNMESYMMSQVLTPIEPESTGFPWDIEALPYPHLFMGTGSGTHR